MKEKLMTLLSEIDKKSLKKILIWGFLSAVAKALPYMFIIMSAAELIKPLAGGTINKKNVDYLLYNDDSVLYYHVYFQYEVMDNHFLRRSLYSEKRQK